MEPYYATLAWIHRTMRPRVYVEIGVSHGESLALASPDTLAIGVDPAATDEASINAPFAKIEPMTSDEFFDVTPTIRSLDLAFIDGMHNFEYALRDFINLERRSHADTVVLIHDVLPISEETSRREPVPGYWTGDVWRLMLILNKYRQDLDITIVNVAPSGLGVVSGLDSSCTVLQDNYEELVSTYLEVPFSQWSSSNFCIVDNNLDELRKLV